MRSGPFSSAEVETLRKMRRNGKSYAEIAKALGRTRASISTKTADIGMSKPKRWFTDEEDEVLRGLVAQKKLQPEIARIMRRSTASIINRVRELGLVQYRESWPPTDDPWKWPEKYRRAA